MSEIVIDRKTVDNLLGELLDTVILLIKAWDDDKEIDEIWAAPDLEDGMLFGVDGVFKLWLPQEALEAAIKIGRVLELEEYQDAEAEQTKEARYNELMAWISRCLTRTTEKGFWSPMRAKHGGRFKHTDTSP